VTVTEGPPPAKKVDEDMLHEVQVGAFEDREQASAALDQVKQWFADAYMAPRNGPAGEYYRVRIGPFESEGEAQRIAAALKRGGHRVFLDEVPESTVPPEAGGHEGGGGSGGKTGRKE
jgi:cell division septation protein DedD